MPTKLLKSHVNYETSGINERRVSLPIFRLNLMETFVFKKWILPILKCPAHSIFHFSIFGQSDKKRKKSADLFDYFLYKKFAFRLKMTGDFLKNGTNLSYERLTFLSKPSHLFLLFLPKVPFKWSQNIMRHCPP